MVPGHHLPDRESTGIGGLGSREESGFVRQPGSPQDSGLPYDLAAPGRAPDPRASSDADLPDPMTTRTLCVRPSSDNGIAIGSTGLLSSNACDTPHWM